MFTASLNEIYVFQLIFSWQLNDATAQLGSMLLQLAEHLRATRRDETTLPNSKKL